MNDGSAPRRTEDPQHLLQDLVIASRGLDDFLQGLAGVAAGTLTDDPAQVLVGALVLRPRARAVIAGTCPTAHILTAIQHRFDDGPCVRAAATGRTVGVEDFTRSAAFPLYGAAALQRGIRSALGVPVRLAGPETAVITFYAREAHAFPREGAERAELFAGWACTPLGLAVRLARLADRTEQLAAAMESRTTIDRAAGVIMAHRRCTQDEAIGILRAASSARNMRLRYLAATVLASAAD